VTRSEKGEHMAERQQQRFHGLFDTVAEMSRMREFWRAGIDPPQEGRTHATAWIPRMDIFARGDDLVIRCELAGVTGDDVELAFDHDALTISGERTGAPEEEDTTFYVRERHYGPFRRTVNLPEGTDRASITAALEDGLLEIVVAGGCAARRGPARIDIRVGGGERS
jgi:HSP20 family protein